MGINRVTATVQVKGDYRKCYEFYTEKVGLVPIYGDGDGPYTNFSNSKDKEPFFAMYCSHDLAKRAPGYIVSEGAASTETLAAVFHTNDFEADYKRLQEAGVKIDRVDMDGEFNMAIFNDPEGNMLSLEDGGV